ncbi:MAG: type IV pilus assembly protein PilW [Cellvibrionaceae bacterium]|jgi:type IV pilus assembly protein PilW
MIKRNSSPSLCASSSLRTVVVKTQSGVGLIELMVSMLIGLLIMAGVVQLYSTTGQNAVAAAASNRIQENIRYVFSRMAVDIAQTGNLGCFSAPFSQRQTKYQEDANGDIAVDENGDFTVIEGSQMLVPVGFDSDASSSGHYESNYNFGVIIGDVAGAVNLNAAPETDILNIRFANNLNKIPVNSVDYSDGLGTITFAEPFDLRRNQVVMIANCTRGLVVKIAAINSDNDGSGTDGNPTTIQLTENDVKQLFANSEDPNSGSITYLYANTTGAYRYFIGTSVAADAQNLTCSPEDDPDDPTFGPQNCALRLFDGAQNQELIEGVHGMDIKYGRFDEVNDTVVFAEDPGTEDWNTDDWNTVDRVEVTLSFNSIENAQITDGNVQGELFTKQVSRVFQLPNQL